MNDILDIEIILKKQKYSFIYNLGIILLIIMFIFVYISFTYKYRTYYITKGVIKNNTLELLVEVDDIKYFTNNKMLEVDNMLYKYKVIEISENIYIDEVYKNYKYIYLNVENLNSMENYVYDVKLEKENKKIIEHIKDYL